MLRARWVPSLCLAMSCLVWAACDDDDDLDEVTDVTVEIESDAEGPVGVDFDDDGVLDADVLAVIVELDRIELRRQNGDFVVLDTFGTQIDLLDGGAEVITASVPEDIFDLVRVVTTTDSIVTVDGVDEPLAIPAGEVGIEVAVQFCPQDNGIVGENRIDILWSVSQGLFFDSAADRLVLEGQAMQVVDAPEC